MPLLCPRLDNVASRLMHQRPVIDVGIDGSRPRESNAGLQLQDAGLKCPRQTESYPIIIEAYSGQTESYPSQTESSHSSTEAHPLQNPYPTATMILRSGHRNKDFEYGNHGRDYAGY
ncbi:uncharacterized protein LOC108161373 [Drosophila miranda]|uniref:uncharacterized protein LOC108161373 n=1 Tax=Drosophila miranda TaxID=7229 RepID=UPI0007E7B6C7|nr:uncharacterized protein LOC108161373 [Drosophila miranda]XP_017151110.1 uncharacterized protein LOC108161373 [Drosophila miranda]XP_017151111.1 uncharacterized protein LOC108161373 [Drosophila miranda]